MPLALLLAAAAAILVGVVMTVLGRTGEMAGFPADNPPLDLTEASPAEVAGLRLPTALWGYQAAATEEALHEIALWAAGRDAEIATLRRELGALRAQSPAAHPAQPPGAGPGPVPEGQPGWHGRAWLGLAERDGDE